MWDKRASLVRVKDGDTIVVSLDQGFRDTKEIDLRLLGVYTPEKGQEGYEACTRFTTEWLASLPLVRWPFVVITARMKLVDREQTTLERYLGTVTTLDGTRCLNLELMQYVAEQGFPLGDT